MSTPLINTIKKPAPKRPRGRPNRAVSTGYGPDVLAIVKQLGRQVSRNVSLISGAAVGILPTSSQGKERNPDPISFFTYDKMRRDPIIKAGLTVIGAPILGRAAIATATSKDPAVKAFVQQTLIDSGLFFRLVKQNLRALALGVDFNEKVWDIQDLLIEFDEIVTDSETKTDPSTGTSVTVPVSRTESKTAWDGPALVYKDIVSVNPVTVKYIKRRDKAKDGKPGDGSYDGFAQTGTPEVVLEPASTYVYTHESEFGNMWGWPRIREAYAPWYWLQMIQKQWFAWGEKKASPPRIILHPDGIDRRTGLAHADIAIAIGNMIDSVSTIGLPSVRDKEGNLVWDFKDIAISDRTDIFEKIVNYLQKLILWSMFVPEHVFTNDQQQTGGGSFAQTSAHTDTWLLTLDALLKDIFGSINRWVVKPLVGYNFGIDADECTVVTTGLTDEERSFLREVFMKILDDTPRYRAQVDFGELADKFSVPQQEVDEALLAAGFSNNVGDASGDSGKGNPFDNGPRPGGPNGPRSERRTPRRQPGVRTNRPDTLPRN